MSSPSSEITQQRVDELFDLIDSSVSACNRDHVRKRINDLLTKLNELDAHESKDTDPAHVSLARRAQEIMTLNVNKPLTIPQIAHECSTSPTMLKQTFRAVMGVPIYQWYRSYRIGMAQELLEGTDLPIAQISAAVGYTNPSKFAKAFREEVGETPREWRAARGL